MGAVWLAEDELLNREVAIKEIQRRGRLQVGETDPEVRRMFREAQAAAKLHEHPGIINVHDVVMHEGLPWIVMERLHGGSLADALQNEGPMPVDRAARIGIEVLNALDYAHRKDVLHRDVKPGNIMLAIRPEGVQVVLTDFGIAIMKGDSKITATGHVPGAPEYIAPERIKGEPATAASDMWSVGITLYHMVVGRTPYQRPDIEETLAAVLSSQEPDPHPNIGRLWPVVQGLLRKKPAERMPATDAITRLRKVAAIAALPPISVTRSVEPPTAIENLAGQETIADETKPNTRSFLPPLPPPEQRQVVAPDDPTVDPVAPQRASRAPLWILTSVIALLLVVVVVWLAVRNSTSAGQNTPANSTTTPSSAPPPSLKQNVEARGFEISVPPDWARDATLDGPVTDVAWQGKALDPSVGALKVQVTKDTTKSGTTALGYLTDKADSENRNNPDYERLHLVDRGGNVADLEYVYGSAAGGTRFHFQSQAISRDDAMYVVTFSLYATTPEKLEAQWQDAQPTIDRIRESFRVTGQKPR
jgi:eukaryotic-like serine/threonine-protein kinase